MQKLCWRYLNWAPFKVKDNDWVATINKAMVGIEERTTVIPKETDTSVTGELHNLFLQYLTHSQIQNGQPYMIRNKLVYHADGVYYFTTEGIMAFLRFEKFSLGKINLHAQLKAYGCTDGELRYGTPRGEERTVKCWIKNDDEELLEMSVFYEDVYDGDADVIRKAKLNKEESDDNVKF
jgi:hypothetical protein